MVNVLELPPDRPIAAWTQTRVRTEPVRHPLPRPMVPPAIIARDFPIGRAVHDCIGCAEHGDLAERKKLEHANARNNVDLMRLHVT